MTNTFDYFDERSSNWTNQYSTDDRFRRRYDRITALIGKHTGTTRGNALDAGCGSGVFSVFLAEEGWEVTAIDGSPAMLEEGKRFAKARGVANAISFEQFSIEKYSAEAKFDLVIALSVLEYLPDAELVLARLCAAVGPRGTLVVTVPNRSGALRMLERLAYWLRGKSRNRIMKGKGDYLAVQRTQFSAARVDEIAKAAGLERRAAQYLNAGFTKPRFLMPIFESSWWAAMYCGVYGR